SRQARLPGAPDRRQRRARRRRARAALRAADAAPGRPARRDLVPLARGPDREALPPCAGAGLRLPARLPGLCLRARAGSARSPPEGDPADTARGRGEPARRLGPAPDGAEGGLVVAAWDVAAELLAPAPRPKPKPAAQKRPRPAARRRVTGGVVWIVFVAVLLTGIVALNVAVLRLNVQLDRLSR